MKDFGLIISKKRFGKREPYVVFNNKCFYFRFFTRRRGFFKPEIKIYNYSDTYEFHMENGTFDTEYLIGIFKTR